MKCPGTKKSGVPCDRHVVGGTGWCHLHDPAAASTRAKRGAALRDGSARAAREVLAAKLTLDSPDAIRAALEAVARAALVAGDFGGAVAAARAAGDALRAGAARRNGSVVYFVREGAGGPIKIGTSTKVLERVAALQCSAAKPLTLLATMPGGRSEEARLHARFASLRVSGEWFDPHPDLLGFIDEISADAAPDEAGDE